mgnify:CR=1 FL=1
MPCYSISGKSHKACLCNTTRHRCSALCLPQSLNSLVCSVTWPPRHTASILRWLDLRSAGRSPQRQIMLDLATVLKAAPMTLPEPLGAPISATTSSAVKGLPVRAMLRMQITASLCQLSCDSLAIVMPSTINSIAWCLQRAQNLGDVAPCSHNSLVIATCNLRNGRPCKATQVGNYICPLMPLV